MRSNVAFFTGSSGLGGFDSENDHSTPLCPGGGVDPAGQGCETCAYGPRGKALSGGSDLLIRREG